MKHDPVTPNILDVKAFARAGQTLVGRDVLSKYERLMHETQGVGADRVLEWTARGEVSVNEAGVAQIWLHLNAEISFPMTCQRCMAPANMAITVNQAFRFVENEEEAEAQDAEADEDILVLSRNFDLTALIEDEVLMALPLVPRHDVCPVEPKLALADAEFETAMTKKQSPFSALGKLKGN